MLDLRHGSAIFLARLINETEWPGYIHPCLQYMAHTCPDVGVLQPVEGE